MASGASFRSDLLDGARDILPLLPGAASIGLVTGVAATSVGIPATLAVAMSVVVNSPLVMLTAFHLVDVGAPLLVIVVASLVVGARFAMLSLSLAPYVERLSTRWKWLVAYFLVTPTYVVVLEEYGANPDTDRAAYYLGVALPGWVVVNLALIAGVWFGASLPASWHLDFVLPLAFIALLTRFLTLRPGQVAALAAGVVAVVAAGLPLGTSVIVAAVCGVLAGLVTDRLEATR